jgi:hypothetical protein
MTPFNFVKVLFQNFLHLKAPEVVFPGTTVCSAFSLYSVCAEGQNAYADCTLFMT